MSDIITSKSFALVILILAIVCGINSVIGVVHLEEHEKTGNLIVTLLWATCFFLGFCFLYRVWGE